MQQGKLILILMLLSTLPGCGLLKPHIEFVPKEIVTTRYKDVPQGLLRRHCKDLSLSDLVTQADVESALAAAWLCIQDHNRDKDDIEGLK